MHNSIDRLNQEKNKMRVINTKNDKGDNEADSIDTKMIIREYYGKYNIIFIFLFGVCFQF